MELRGAHLSESLSGCSTKSIQYFYRTCLIAFKLNACGFATGNVAANVKIACLRQNQANQNKIPDLQFEPSGFFVPELNQTITTTLSPKEIENLNLTNVKCNIVEDLCHPLL